MVVALQRRLAVVERDLFEERAIGAPAFVEPVELTAGVSHFRAPDFFAVVEDSLRMNTCGWRL
jgi:hypothetical protein